MVNKPSGMSQKQLKKRLIELMDKVIEANKAYCDELDKPKRDRTARRLLRQAHDDAFNELMEFMKEHEL